HPHPVPRECGRSAEPAPSPTLPSRRSTIAPHPRRENWPPGQAGGWLHPALRAYHPCPDGLTTIPVVGARLDRTAAEELLRAMHEHTTEDTIQHITPLIHEDAQMRLLVSFGKLLEGREAVVDALAGGWAADTFRARILRFEWLDESTSLTFAHARYALESGGFA